MANEFICSRCKGDGTRCNCYRNRKPAPYQTSEADQRMKEQLDLRAEWRKFGVEYKIPTLITNEDNLK